MEFFKCSIGGVAYGAGITEIERNNAERWDCRRNTNAAVMDAALLLVHFLVNLYQAVSCHTP
jgi:hypothetical protein